MPHGLTTLSMDSAAQVGSTALLVGERLLVRDYFQGESGHAVLLPAKIVELLTTTGLSCADLDLIVVTIGPGAFAGLRIALGCAKGIALVLGTPVVGVSNLDLLAAAAAAEQQEGWLSVVVDARRGEIFAALYRLENGRPHKHTAPPWAISPAAWAATLADMPELQQDRLCLTGTGLGPYANVFRDQLTGPFIMAPESAWIADPFLLGRLGQQHFVYSSSAAEGKHSPFSPESTMLLDYQRRPDAEEKKYGTPCISGP
ncbi:MAG: tRNA (adenosine(37)-N6)-threonylcarbamoyltransferase complex dimerization subunit type 1 TsaB [Magnetococcales bacterium]|nr:tRNA (adenosine(37)-N6)-threonylcarbamoyltransferase complex dimerization subunit type 1 TsaB [Magnetococcales bacterium]